MTNSQYPNIKAFWHRYGVGYFIDCYNGCSAVAVGEKGNVQFAEGIENGRSNKMWTVLVRKDVRGFALENDLVSITFGKGDLEPLIHIIGRTQDIEAAKAWVNDVNALYKAGGEQKRERLTGALEKMQLPPGMIE